MDASFDGKQFLELYLLSAIMQGGDPFMSKVMKIFQKYNIGVMDGMAILMELAVALESATKEKKNGDGQ